MEKKNIEVGDICDTTGGIIKKLKVKVFLFTYGNIHYSFFNDYTTTPEGEQVDLQNKKINWGQYVGKVCYVWGDFLPNKITRTGKIKRKFLVLRIQIADKETVAE